MYNINNKLNLYFFQCRHFIQYWNYVAIDIEYGNEYILN